MYDAGVAASRCDALQREGYTVHHFETGQDALQHVQQQSPNLIVLDVRLPDITGFDVCRGMRQLGLHQPIIMLTVQGDLIDRRRYASPTLTMQLDSQEVITSSYGILPIEPNDNIVITTGEVRSSQTVTLPVIADDGTAYGTVTSSDGPVYGVEIVNSVACGWSITSTGAIALAMIVGVFISREITRPLVKLIGTTIERTL